MTQNSVHESVSYNHQILPASDVAFSAVSSGSLYGKSIFTTIAIYDSELFLWTKHWARLLDNARRIGLDFGFSEHSVEASLTELISRNNVVNGRARVTFFDETARGIWATECNKRTSVLIVTGESNNVMTEMKLTVSPYRTNSASPLANTKSGNYLENILAFDEARKRGFEEAIRLNERGEITSGCLANIFWIKGGEIFTPSLATGCLAGTTRELILERCNVAEVAEQIKILESAEAIFLTSSGLGIRQVWFNKYQPKSSIFADLLPQIQVD